MTNNTHPSVENESLPFFIFHREITEGMKCQGKLLQTVSHRSRKQRKQSKGPSGSSSQHNQVYHIPNFSTDTHLNLSEKGGKKKKARESAYSLL